MSRIRANRPKQKIEFLLTKQEIAILTTSADDEFRTIDEQVAFLIMQEWKKTWALSDAQQQAQTEDAPA